MPIPTSQARQARSASSPAEALSALGRGPIKPEHLLALSDLSRSDAKTLASVWPAVPTEERISIVRQLHQLSEDRVELLFGRVFRVAITDASPVVRQIAISGLWEDDGRDVIESLIAILHNDESEDVRAEAATALARFADRAATGDLEDRISELVREALLAATSRAEVSPLVRRRALESIAVFGQAVGANAMIADSYAHDDTAERASALYAMGRTLDRTWLAAIVDAFGSDDAELRYEAARASGELGHVDAVQGLSDLVRDNDVEVRQAAISSLGKIGGRAATRVLESYRAECPASDEELVDDALQEASSLSEASRAEM